LCDRKRKLLLIDGHGLAYRAFFALPVTMTNDEGQPINAVYGFVSMLLKALETEEPDAIIVALDGPRAQLKRTQEFPEYKAHRPAMPVELKGQIEMIERMLCQMRIPVVTVPGFEADDILGTLALKVSGEGGEAVIVTGDRDILQLVRPGVRVVMTSRGITETESFDRRAVEDKYGVPPSMLPEVAGLKGDASDNIPGVPGIGKKWSVDLLRRYGSLEELYARLDEIEGTKRREALEENREIAFLSRKLATLDTNVPVEIDAGEAILDNWDKREVLECLLALKFKTLARRFQDTYGLSRPARGLSAGQAGLTFEVARAYSLVDPTDDSALSAFELKARETGAAGVSSVLSGAGFCDIGLQALALATGEMALVARVEAPAAFEIARGIIESQEVQKWFHDAKPTLEALDKLEISAARVTFDTKIAAYLENPSLDSYRLFEIYERNVEGDVVITGHENASDPSEQPSLIDLEPSGARHAVEDIEAVRQAAMVFHLKPVIEEKLRALGMKKLADELELPFLFVLKEMEETGIALDAEVLLALAREAASTLGVLEKEIYRLAGHEFKIGSTKQLAHVLFDELGLPPARKTKTGYSTDASVLEALKGSHDIVGKLIEYREYAKLKSTYLDVLPALVCASTGRVHCRFNQTAGATGRISSSNPNLQNIPVRTEFGREIRRAFIPGRGFQKLLVADYSQIELRVLAHMSGDTRLLAAFERDADIHSETASHIFKTCLRDVTPEMRRMAKVVNFGIVYGMGYYGLSSRLGISVEDATAYIDTYFETYEGVSAYRERCVSDAIAKGYSETILGRRRNIPELASPNRHTREFGERVAVNTPLQGTAADIIKKAMVDVSTAIKERGMTTRMILQVHDELVFEAPALEIESLESLVREKMISVVDLLTPLKVDIGVHDNWNA